MNLDDWDFDLPDERIARHPAARRDDSRLLHLPRTGSSGHHHFRDLPTLLREGDLLVANDTRVMAARLPGQRDSGGKLEVLLLASGPGPLPCMIRNARRLSIGEQFLVGDRRATLLRRLPEGLFEIDLPDAEAVMAEHGALPIPPYLGRPEEPGDRERYQTVFAGPLGAAAAPTAGLHFTPHLMERLEHAGIGFSTVTLHVGIGTFRPLRQEDLERGELHPEAWNVPGSTAERIRTTREAGGRVIAVGTTSARTIESATPAGSSEPRAGSGVTRLFLHPNHPPRVVDGLITNFHLPRSSLLLLVASLAGRQRLLDAYAEAIALDYRFYSYGDAMLLLERPARFRTRSTLGAARTGVLSLPHGDVPTPAFMPVGTYGTVRGLLPRELRDLGSSIVLSNTYHLWIRPGHETVGRLGGLHRFMGWDGPILTDSGGYQVFSLKNHLKVREEGVHFRVPDTGEARHLTPEGAIEIQETLGVDVAMAFDECIEWPADRDRVGRSTERTTRWLHRCLAARQHSDRTALFGIVQGGLYEDLRVEHAQELQAMDALDGVAIGGLSVGEARDDMLAATSWVVPHLGDTRVRYLMGVGHPSDIVDAVLLGIDLFDCVLPTRLGRHGMLYTWEGRRNLKNARYAEDPLPLDPTDPDSPTGDFSRAYLRHMVKNGEMLGRRLLSAHNLHFYQTLLKRVRAAIDAQDAVALQGLREVAHRASALAED